MRFIDKILRNFYSHREDNLFRVILSSSSLIMMISLVLGVYLAFYHSLEDYQQGEMVRIMYIHVPSAWMSLIIYSFVASSSFIYLIWRNPLFNIIAYSAAPIGAIFAFITLITGSIWGKPIWGTWWVWDARLTSMLILFLFYISYLLLNSSIKDIDINSIAPAILSIVGLINVPIVKFSVNLWNSLHQPASIIRKGGLAIDSSMLKPLIVIFVFSLFYFFTNLIIKVNIELTKKKINRLKYNKSFKN